MEPIVFWPLIAMILSAQTACFTGAPLPPYCNTNKTCDWPPKPTYIQCIYWIKYVSGIKRRSERIILICNLKVKMWHFRKCQTKINREAPKWACYENFNMYLLLIWKKDERFIIPVLTLTAWDMLRTQKYLHFNKEIGDV